MKDFKAPKQHYFDFTGVLTALDRKRVDKYVRDIDQEIAIVSKYLARLQHQRAEAAVYRVYDATGIPRTQYDYQTTK